MRLPIDDATINRIWQHIRYTNDRLSEVLNDFGLTFDEDEIREQLSRYGYVQCENCLTWEEGIIDYCGDCQQEIDEAGE